MDPARHHLDGLPLSGKKVGGDRFNAGFWHLCFLPPALPWATNPALVLAASHVDSNLDLGQVGLGGHAKL